jgi:hypothetical protein
MTAPFKGGSPACLAAGFSPASHGYLRPFPPQIGFSLGRLSLVEALRFDDGRSGEGVQL